jgi:lipoprotein-releasing system permease protein
VKLAFFIAGRYLFAKRKGLFAWVTSLIGIGGVALGVAALITTLSVMNGFQSDIRSKIIGAQSHIVVSGAGSPLEAESMARELAKTPNVVAASPYSLGQAILQVHGRSVGVVVKGMEPALEFTTSELQGRLTEGDWSGIETKSSDGRPGVVLGEELAHNIGAFLGEEVLLLSPEGAMTPLGMMPRLVPFKVVGLLKTGYYEYDASMAYLSLDSAHDVFKSGAGYGVQLKLRSLDLLDQVAARLRQTLGWGHTIRTYKDLNRTLFAALKLEKFVMFVIMGLIVLVAAFNIASNLILLTNEKTRDIGLLRSMGATPAAVRAIFLLEGTLIGFTGVGLGVALGLVLSWVIGTFPIVELPADIYYLSRVPIAIVPADVLLVSGVGLALCLLATLIPAFRAARLSPVEAIHYG